MVYLISDIKFGNGISLIAELIYISYILIFLTGFSIGNYSKIPISGFGSISINRLNIFFLILTISLFVVYVLFLTNWDISLIFTSPIELKHHRLDLALVQKDFKLSIIEAVTSSFLTLSLIWAIVGHKDDAYSNRAMILLFLMVLMQVLSTGSRNPLIGFSIIIYLSLYYSYKISNSSNSLFKFINKYKLAFILVIFIYMVITTSSRIEFEGLSSDVFVEYFDIRDFGVVEYFFKSQSGALYLIGTIIVYISSTFNNFVIKFQNIFLIDYSYGYQFLFPYINFFESKSDSYGIDLVSSMKQINTNNNDRLVQISASATQWSTPFGDFLWDFGLLGSFFILLIFSMLFGYLTRFNRIESFTSVSLKIIFLSSLILPLVNPFSSLQFHISILIIIFINLSIVLKKRLLIDAQS